MLAPLKLPERTPLTLPQAAARFAHQGGYLNSASIGLPPVEVIEALQEVLQRWSVGDVGPHLFDEHVELAREGFADLLHVPKDWIANHSAASGLVAVVARSLRPGAKVLIASGDFASLLFPFLERAQAGELDVQEVPLDALIDSIGPDTDLVAVSAVQSSNGQRIDHEALIQATTQHKALTMLDVTQAAGWLDLDAKRFDFVVASAYKWLLCPRGVALMSVRPEHLNTLRPGGASWAGGEVVKDSYYGPPIRLTNTARRLDISPSWLPWTGAAHGISLIQRVGVEAIGAHNTKLADLFLERLDLAPRGSAIVSIPHEGAGQALAKGNITVSQRRGATRLAFHLYNTEEDAIRAADVVRALS